MTILSLTKIMLSIVVIALLMALASPRLLAFVCVLPLIMVIWFFIKTRTTVIPSNVEMTKKTVIFLLPVGLGLISALWAIDAAEVMERTLKILPHFLLGGALVLMMMRVPWQNETRFLNLILYIAAVLIFLLGLEHALDMPLTRTLYGDGKDWMGFAFFNRRTIALMCLVFPFAVAAYHCKHYITLGILVIVSLFLLFQTQSQSAQLAMAAAVIALFIPWHCTVTRWCVYAGIIGFTLAAPFVMPFAYDHVSVDVMSVPVLHDAAPLARLEIWDFVARYALQKPLTGYGLDATRMITDFDGAAIHHTSNLALHPHSYALQLWIEFGVIGCIAFAALLYKLFAYCGTLKEQEQKLAFAMIMMWFGVAVAGYSLWQAWWLGLTFFMTVTFIFVTRVFLRYDCGEGKNPL